MSSKSLIALTFSFSLLCLPHDIKDCVEARKATPTHNSRSFIKTKFGDIYDCVDIYKQPASSHPLLRHHKIQMRPSSHPTFLQVEPIERKIGRLPESCATGTVAVPRRKKHNMNMTRFPIDGSGLGFDFAGFIIKPESGKTYQGGTADLNIYNPSAGPQQFSGTTIQVSSGIANNMAYIRIGWLVDPDLNHDSQTRTFIEWQESKDGQVKGCFNVDCPGFVITSSRAYVDAVLSDVSTMDGPQFVQTMLVFRDPQMPNWWVYMTNDEAPVGYYPKELFSTGLENGANEIFMGGIVYTATPTSPPMGTSTYNSGIYSEDCFMQRVRVLKEGDGTTFSEPGGSTITEHSIRCYITEYTIYESEDKRFTIYFGGEGGDAKTCI